MVMPTILGPLSPRRIEIGMMSAGIMTSFPIAAQKSGFLYCFIWPNLNDAPKAIMESGVVRLLSFETIPSIIQTGMTSPLRLRAIPTKLETTRGFFMMFRIIFGTLVALPVYFSKMKVDRRLFSGTNMTAMTGMTPRLSCPHMLCAMGIPRIA